MIDFIPGEVCHGGGHYLSPELGNLFRLNSVSGGEMGFQIKRQLKHFGRWEERQKGPVVKDEGSLGRLKTEVQKVLIII